MQHRVGSQKDGNQVGNHEGHPDTGEGTAQDRPNPRPDIKIERTAAAKRGQYLEAQGRTGQNAQLTIVQEAIALGLTREIRPAEGPPHKEDKIAAEIALVRTDLRPGGGEGDIDAGQAHLQTLMPFA